MVYGLHRVADSRAADSRQAYDPGIFLTSRDCMGQGGTNLCWRSRGGTATDPSVTPQHTVCEEYPPGRALESTVAKCLCLSVAYINH